MLRLVCLLSAISLVLAQSGTNYQTGDGQVRSESVDPEGNVRGSYSYIDPNGKTITTHYSAGKGGFKVEGDHIPRGPGAAPQPELAPSSFSQPPTGPQFSQFPLSASARQFPQFPQPSTAPQFDQVPRPSALPQFSPSAGAPQFGQFPQQPLFAPSSANFGQAASQAQVAQFRDAQAPQPAPLASGQYQPQADFQAASQFDDGSYKENYNSPAPQPPQQQFSLPPPPFRQQPAAAPRFTQPQSQQFSSPQLSAQFSPAGQLSPGGQFALPSQLPAGTQFTSANQLPAGTQYAAGPQFAAPGPQFSQEQLAQQYGARQQFPSAPPQFAPQQYNQQQYSPQQIAQLSQLAQQSPVAFPEAPHRFNTPAAGAPTGPASQYQYTPSQ